MQTKKGLSFIIIAAICLVCAALPVRATTLTTPQRSQSAATSAVSPFNNCTAGGAGTLYANAEVEPWVVINPTNPNNIVAVWQQDRWSNGGARGLVTSATHDGGLTWKRSWAHFSQCAGGNATNGGAFVRASDPWLAFAPNGDLYQTSLSVTFSPVTTGVLVSKSTDGGDTWSEPYTVLRDTDPRFFNDKESITADPLNADYVYLVWDRVDRPSQSGEADPEENREGGTQAPAMFARTTDAGRTWEKPRIIYDPGANNSTLANQIVVQPNGTLVNFFSESVTPLNRRRGPADVYISLVRSKDRGMTWGKVIRAVKLSTQGARNPDTNKSIRALGFIPEVAVDPHNGNLYAVWQDSRFRKVDEIAFIMSTDGGDTWSIPIKISQTPTSTITLNQQAFLPAIHVADDGAIGVTYYDFRNNTAAAGVPTDYWLVSCRPTTAAACTNPVNWQHEHRLTNLSFDIEQAPAEPKPLFFVGDYQGLTHIGNSFFSVFIAVNNNNPDNRTSVFYTRITP